MLTAPNQQINTKHEAIQISQLVRLDLAAAGKASKYNFKRSERLRSYSFENITHTSMSMQHMLAESSPAILAQDTTRKGSKKLADFSLWFSTSITMG